MKNNEELRVDIMAAIKMDPLLNTSEIVVIAKDGC
jgi:hypothetical protein